MQTNVAGRLWTSACSYLVDFPMELDEFGRLRPSRWCPGKDSNLHGLHRWYLKPVRLPIPPPGHGASHRSGGGRMSMARMGVKTRPAMGRSPVSHEANFVRRQSTRGRCPGRRIRKTSAESRLLRRRGRRRRTRPRLSFQLAKYFGRCRPREARLIMPRGRGECGRRVGGCAFDH